MAKQYLSPIRLFEHSSITCDGEINLSRIKKQLTAEFDFAHTGFIEIDGYTYNKNDVLEEVERTDFAERLLYHKKIWETKSILSVLEDNSVDLRYVKAGFDRFQNDPFFDALFSPYFAAPFNHISRYFINESNLYDLGEWLRFEDFLLPADREEGFRSIRVFLEENNRVFRNISQENYNSFRSKVEHWIHPGWEKFLNNLPDDFYSFKNNIIVDLVNLTVKIQKSNREDCRSISRGLIQLQGLSGDLRDTIHSNDQAYNGQAVSTSSSSGNYWWVLWVVIAFLRLISHGGCN